MLFGDHDKKLAKLKATREKEANKYKKEAELDKYQKDIENIRKGRSKLKPRSSSNVGAKIWGGLSNAATNYGEMKKSNKSYGAFGFGTGVEMQSKKKKMSQTEKEFFGL